MTNIFNRPFLSFSFHYVPLRLNFSTKIFNIYSFLSFFSFCSSSSQHLLDIKGREKKIHCSGSLNVSSFVSHSHIPVSCFLFTGQERNRRRQRRRNSLPLNALINYNIDCQSHITIVWMR